MNSTTAPHVLAATARAAVLPPALLKRRSSGRLQASSLPARTSTTLGQPAPIAVDPNTTDARGALRTAVFNQLAGPHFQTWLDPGRFNPDRLAIQSRRLWYYSTLLAPEALGGMREFSAEELKELRIAADNAFAGLHRFR